jgi:hypothetical protein
MACPADLVIDDFNAKGGIAGVLFEASLRNRGFARHFMMCCQLGDRTLRRRLHDVVIVVLRLDLTADGDNRALDHRR